VSFGSPNGNAGDASAASTAVTTGSASVTSTAIGATAMPAPSADVDYARSPDSPRRMDSEILRWKPSNPA
jgi:hypothetical protein